LEGGEVEGLAVEESHLRQLGMELDGILWGAGRL